MDEKIVENIGNSAILKAKNYHRKNTNLNANNKKSQANQQHQQEMSDEVKI